MKIKTVTPLVKKQLMTKAAKQLSKELKKATESLKEIEDLALGYDDSISAKRRAYLREHILNNPSFYEYYMGINIEKTNMMVKEMTNKGSQKLLPQKIKIDETIIDKEIRPQTFNVIIMQSDGIKAALPDDPKYFLKSIKKSGIETIIDFHGCGGYEEECKKKGLNYLFFRISDDFWKENVALKKEDGYLREQKKFLEEIHTNWSKDEIESQLKDDKEDFKKGSRTFINGLINYFDTINKGRFCAGCCAGMTQSKTGLILSQYLNPKDVQEIELDLLDIGSIHEVPSMARKLLNLYENFTEEDKIRMGYTKEYEEKVVNRLNFSIKQCS